MTAPASSFPISMDMHQQLYTHLSADALANLKATSQFFNNTISWGLIAKKVIDEMQAKDSLCPEATAIFLRLKTTITTQNEATLKSVGPIILQILRDYDRVDGLSSKDDKNVSPNPYTALFERLNITDLKPHSDECVCGKGLLYYAFTLLAPY